MKRLTIFAAIGCLMFSGCRSDPFHVETHYPKEYYRQIEREDQAWLDYCQTNNL